MHYMYIMIRSVCQSSASLFICSLVRSFLSFSLLIFMYLYIFHIDAVVAVAVDADADALIIIELINSCSFKLIE
jgi:hypothetical protein